MFRNNLTIEALVEEVQVHTTKDNLFLVIASLFYHTVNFKEFKIETSI